VRPFLEDFYQRRREVRRYISVLRLWEKKASISEQKRHALEAKILRAGAVLIVYNAVEASSRSAIEAIYDEINKKATPFDHLTERLRRRIVVDFKKNASTQTRFGNIALEIISSSFNADSLFMGNVDVRKIRENAEDFGFQIPKNGYQRHRNGEDLLSIKERRTDLTHGLSSFSAVGANYTSMEIVAIARHCMMFMEDVLLAVNEYLDSEGYLDQSQKARLE